MKMANRMAGTASKSMSTYEAEVVSRLHPSYCGLREGRGLHWLSRTLERLEGTGDPGLAEIVRSFTRQMHRRETAEAFLLEIEVADSLLDLSTNVHGNRQEGMATGPCDLTMLEGARVDIQCKAVRNITNEMYVEELESWLIRQFRDLAPGLGVTIKPNTSADDTTMAELKAKLVADLSADWVGREVTFTDSRGLGTGR